MFKKILGLMMATMMTLSLVACGQTPASSNISAASSESAVSGRASESQAPVSSEDETSVPAQIEAPETTDTNTLVVYFSWSGNTEEMASYIAEQTGSDLYEIVPQTPYPEDYNKTGEIAEKERDDNVRPAIANLPDYIEQYDTIIVGYPIWWHTAPMIIGTFLENYDLTGKEIYPFTQSASMDTEQFDSSIEFVRENANGATVHDGLFARPSDTAAIDAYLSENGITE
ncbi:hypothetical protein NIF40_11940 [[Clostridium] leptum]|nr:hypothetical protein [[Clostridium] leptum]